MRTHYFLLFAAAGKKGEKAHTAFSNIMSSTMTKCTDQRKKSSLELFIFLALAQF
jgi:hypothetical protein